MSLFASKIPEEAICNFTDYSDRTVHLYAWVDKNRGQGTQVQYTQQTAGTFSLSIPIKDGDVDLLKLQACTRVRDSDTGNVRTITLAVSAVQMDKLLEGKTITTTMHDPFSPEDAVVVTLSAENAHEFANCISNQPVLIPVISGGPDDLPFIRFQRSSLWDIAQINAEVDKVSEHIQSNIKLNNTRLPPGGDMFASGISR